MATRRQAERAVDQHERALSALPNVVGLGVQPADEPDAPGYQVAVYVARKVPQAQLGPGEAVPEAVEVSDGGTQVSVPVTVIETGEFAFE